MCETIRRIVNEIDRVIRDETIDRHAKIYEMENLSYLAAFVSWEAGDDDKHIVQEEADNYDTREQILYVIKWHDEGGDFEWLEHEP